MAKLQDVCSKDTIVNYLYYGDIHRARFTVNNETRDWDITHIVLPVSMTVKERMARMFPDNRLNKPQDELNQLFANNIQCSTKLTKHLYDSKSRYVLPHAAIKSEIDAEGNTHIFLISEPSEILAKALNIVPNGQNSLQSIIFFTENMFRICIEYDAMGVNLGTIDPNEIRIITRNSASHIYYSNMFFALKQQNKKAYQPEYYLPHTHPSLLNGAKPSLLTDIYSAASIAWSLINGYYFGYETAKDSVPDNIPKEIIEILKYAMNTEALAQEGTDPQFIIQNLTAKLHNLSVSNQKSDESFSKTIIFFNTKYTQQTTAKPTDTSTETANQEGQNLEPNKASKNNNKKKFDKQKINKTPSQKAQNIPVDKATQTLTEKPPETLPFLQQAETKNTDDTDIKKEQSNSKKGLFNNLFWKKTKQSKKPAIQKPDNLDSKNNANEKTDLPIPAEDTSASTNKSVTKAKEKRSKKRKTTRQEPLGLNTTITNPPILIKQEYEIPTIQKKMLHSSLQVVAIAASVIIVAGSAWYFGAPIVRLYLDENNNQQNIEQSVDKPQTPGHSANSLVHFLVKVERIEPTCTTEGRREYWRCSECDSLFADSNTSTRLSEDEIVLPCTPHKWTTLETEDGTLKYICSVCGQTSD